MNSHHRNEDQYLDCYDTLGVTPAVDMDGLRIAYRRRIRSCHPDLVPAGECSREREDEFKRVVDAYRSLLSFHRAHDHLPLQDHGRGRMPSFMPSSRSRFQAEADNADERKPFRWARTIPRLHQAAFAVFVAGVGSAALVGHIHGGEPAAKPVNADTGKLAIGMDSNSVVSLHGVPNYTKGSVWFYGESGVIFERGCVVGWENQPPFPLQTRVTSAYLTGSQSRSVSRDCSQGMN